MTEETIAALLDTVESVAETSPAAVFELPTPAWATWLGWEYVPILLFFIFILLLFMIFFRK